MKTTTVMSSELGDDWTPAAHMPRVLTEAQFLKPGDRVRVRDHSSTTDGERRWHPATVQDIETQQGHTVAIKVDTWPICYVCARDELVELVEITRTAPFRCLRCVSTDHQDMLQVTVTLEDFIETELLKRGNLHAVIVQPHPFQVTGYCKTHATELLT